MEAIPSMVLTAEDRANMQESFACILPAVHLYCGSTKTEPGAVATGSTYDKYHLRERCLQTG
jgi:hypothetical protein